MISDPRELTPATPWTATRWAATAEESLPSENVRLVPEWAEKQGFADNPAAVRGATLFAEAGCMNCHTYLGAGATNLGAPDLSDIGATGGKTAAQFAEYVANAPGFGNNSMPPYGEKFGGALTDKQLADVGEFLAASKGG